MTISMDEPKATTSRPTTVNGHASSSTTTTSKAGPSTSSASQTKYTIDATDSPHLAEVAAFADQVAAQPQRFALSNGDETTSTSALKALCGVFSQAVNSEFHSLSSIARLIRESVGPEPSTTRRSGKKRKRNVAPQQHSLFPATPISELVTDGMGDEQIWQQLEFRGKAIENVLSMILVSEGAVPEEDEEEADDELRKKSRHDEEAEDDEREIAINSLSSLSDAELRALGIDPSLRQELIKGVTEGDDGDEDFHPSDEDDDDEEAQLFPFGYPGSSDLSSDEDDVGSSKRVYYQPLRTEREQRRRKKQQEMEELRRIRALQRARRAASMAAGKKGKAVDDDDDEEEEEEEEEEEDIDDEEEDEDEDEDEDSPDVPSPPSQRTKSLLDSLDEPGTQANPNASRAGFKGPRHKSLDDDFFSIDDFNRQTEETERREIFKEAGADDADDDEEIDYFRPTAGEDDGAEMDVDGAESSPFGDASEIRYSDFFDPPPRGSGLTNAQKRSKGKGKGSRVGQGAKLAKQERDREAAAALEDAEEEAEAEAQGAEDEQLEEDEDEDFDDEDFDDFDDDLDSDEDDDEDEDEDESESGEESDDQKPARPNTRVKFAPQVAIRNIKARANKSMEDIGAISPEMLRQMSGDAEEADGEEEEDGASDDASDGEDGDEDEDEEDEEEDNSSEDAHEVDSEMGESVGGGIDENEEMETAHRFADDLFGDEEDDEGDKSGKGSSAGRVSAHERRLAQLQEEIKRLEQENVSAKDWTLSGEASSRARPQDSLLEQDLDFEQSSKPTPTITVDVTEALEELIKRRILENRFDDVVPRRAFTQPEYKAEFELSDRKSGKSLAEEYEEDYQRRQGGESGPVKGENEKRLDKDRAEIESLMEDVFDKLDALSNAHFTPKAPKATITTLTSAPSLNVEDGSASSSSQLAPQEVFSNQGSSSEHFIGSKGELTPKEKAKLHQKRKQARKNDRLQSERDAAERGLNKGAGAKVQPASGGRGERKEKEDALKKLIGNKGVSVVGKGGGVRNDAKKSNGTEEKKGEKFKL